MVLDSQKRDVKQSLHKKLVLASYPKLYSSIFPRQITKALQQTPSLVDGYPGGKDYHFHFNYLLRFLFHFSLYFLELLFCL